MLGVIELEDSSDEYQNMKCSQSSEPNSSIDGSRISERARDEDINLQPKARHRRKSTHNMIRSSDIEFAMLPVEGRDGKGGEIPVHQDSVKRKIPKSNIVSKIPSRQTTPEEIFNASYENFVKEDKTISLIREIAVERLRINTLLRLNGMPEINFPLYAKMNRIGLQIEDRFKQRKLQQYIKANQGN